MTAEINWDDLPAGMQPGERLNEYKRLAASSGLAVRRCSRDRFSPDAASRMFDAMRQRGVDYMSMNGFLPWANNEFVEVVSPEGLERISQGKDPFLPWGQLAGFDRCREASLYHPEEQDVAAMLRPEAEDGLALPVGVTIDITGRCNLRCSKCVYQQAKGEARRALKLEDMELPLFEALVDEIKTWPRKPSLTLAMRGEPLVHRNLFKLTARLAKEGLPFCISTNGLLLDAPTLDRLTGDGLYAVNFSLDAALPETYRDLIGVDRFPTVTAHLENMLLAAYRGQLATPVLNFVLSERNRHELAEFEARWLDKTLCVKIVHLEDLCSDRGTSGQYFALPKVLPCSTAWSTMYVMSDGSLRRCCQDIPPQEPLGAFPETSLADAWRGQAYREWRDALFTRSPEAKRFCLKCLGWSKFFGYTLLENNRLTHVSPLIRRTNQLPEAWRTTCARNTNHQEIAHDDLTT